MIEEIIYLKTVTLFEGSFALGWLFGGGDFALLDEVRLLATHFGFAFQVRDDLLDRSQDLVKEACPNLAVFLGQEGALAYLGDKITLLKRSMEELSLTTAPFKLLVNQLEETYTAAVSGSAAAAFSAGAADVAMEPSW